MIDIELPSMGEGVTSATISKWLVKPGDSVEEEDPVVEVATDKVDSEVISPADGIVNELFFNEGDEVSVGEVIGNIKAEAESSSDTQSGSERAAEETVATGTATAAEEETRSTSDAEAAGTSAAVPHRTPSGKFLTPLVRSIAEKEQLSLQELDTIKGTGKGGRLTKDDVFLYVHKQKDKVAETPKASADPHGQKAQPTASQPEPATPKQPATNVFQGTDNYEVVKMDRMRKLIADHMVTSKQTSPHVTSFIEVDVTALVEWRNQVKNTFQQKYNEKLTFTPLFIEATVKALKDYPMVNVSLNGDEIIVKKNINIGMATALPNGNLIVPVIKHAEGKNLLGVARDVNDLAQRARSNKLKPDEIKGGTFTITNLGNFGNMTGTPVINQPEVAILAPGAITKKPAVVETPKGDTIGIRQIMVLSMSYDHRVVDGALGGMFLKRVAENLENFDTTQTV